MAGLWTKLRQALAALGAISLAACTTPHAASDEARPALWKLSDADTNIYLFGTIHLLPKGLKWRTPAIERAIAESEALYLETELGKDPMAAAQTMMKLGISPGLPPIAERVPAEKRDAFRKMIASAGVPEAALDRMETWAAALTLMAVSFRQMGFSSEEGVERSLSAGYSKPVKGLETVEQQFGFFDKLSEEAQRALLTGLIDDPGEAKKQFEAMLSAWRRGDTKAIARTFDSEKALSPELRTVLMARRNANWAEWLARRLDQPGTVMVAVGAGHLAGKGSVQELLKAKGLKATRVQ
jgi:uncharacterized protein YbaP (TraB family)